MYKAKTIKPFYSRRRSSSFLLVQPDSWNSGLAQGIFFSLLMSPIFFLNLPLPFTVGWLFFVVLHAAMFAPKALFWLLIGTYVMSSIANILVTESVVIALAGNTVNLHELIWFTITIASLGLLFKRRKPLKLKLNWNLQKLASTTKLALFILTVLIVVATVNTFFNGVEGRWSTGIRFFLSVFPLILSLSVGFKPKQLPLLMTVLRQVSVYILFLAILMMPMMRADLRSIAVFSHLVIIGITYTFLQLIVFLNSQSMRLSHLLYILLGAFTYFVLGSGGLSDMWMFAWAIVLSFFAIGKLYSKPEWLLIGRLGIVALIGGVMAIYLFGPASFINRDITMAAVEESLSGNAVSLLGDSSSNLTDRFLRWRVALEQIGNEPFALKFQGYGSKDAINAAYSEWGWRMSNLVPHNVFLDLAMWLTPIAPFLLIYLLYRFWQSALNAARDKPLEQQIFLLTCAITACLFWLRDFWGTWIVQSYFGASFSFWLVVVLGLMFLALNDDDNVIESGF